ncbi:hypothetical protein HDV00_009760 [Rhizophlyctis rosea]|nr:hypothetical protein HDV00_009760 [Rhizophlyctis rosea]
MTDTMHIFLTILLLIILLPFLAILGYLCYVGFCNRSAPHPVQPLPAPTRKPHNRAAPAAKPKNPAPRVQNTNPHPLAYFYHVVNTNLNNLSHYPPTAPANAKCDACGMKGGKRRLGCYRLDCGHTLCKECYAFCCARWDGCLCSIDNLVF